MGTVGQPNHVSQNSVMDMMVFDVMIQHGRPIAPVIYTIIIVSNIESIAIKGCFSNQTTFIEAVDDSGHTALPGILHTMYSHTQMGDTL